MKTYVCEWATTVCMAIRRVGLNFSCLLTWVGVLLFVEFFFFFFPKAMSHLL